MGIQVSSLLKAPEGGKGESGETTGGGRTATEAFGPGFAECQPTESKKQASESGSLLLRMSHRRSDEESAEKRLDSCWLQLNLSLLRLGQ